MQSAMTRTAVFAPTASRPQAPLPSRRRLVIRAGIPNPFGAGEVNDPEKTAQRKEEKRGEFFKGEPHNKNKLEKRTLAHGIGAEEGSDDINKAEEAINKGVDAVKDVAKKVTGQ